MPRETETHYLWVMEWFNSFARSDQAARYIDVYRITPAPGADAAEFERYMTDEVFPDIGARPTRAPAVVAHYLLKDRGVAGDSLDEVFSIYARATSLEKLRSFGADELRSRYDLVGTWSEGSSTAR